MFNAEKILSLHNLWSISRFERPFRELSLEEKVGQILMPHFNGTEANADAKTLIKEIKVGGFIYYEWSNGLTSPEQVRSLSFSLQSLARENSPNIPLFLATDQEGGVVNRLNEGFTVFPGNKALGETHDSRLAKEAARVMGEELGSVGLNMNLAPDIDLNSNPRNPIIGVRSFGDDPKTVIDFGAQTLQGYHEAYIITTLKHFPSPSDVVIDPHSDQPESNKSLEELKRDELSTFAALSSLADTIMPGHVLVRALDDKECTTLSKKSLFYLKDTIGFKGPIISDSLAMQGVLKCCKCVEDVAIRALEAGCDILLLGGAQLNDEKVDFQLSVEDVRRIHQSIVAAVKSGSLSIERINEAVEKILKLKRKYFGIDSPESHSEPNTPSNQSLAQLIASKSLKMIQQKPLDLLSLRNMNVALFAPHQIEKIFHQMPYPMIGKTLSSYFFSPDPASQEFELVKEMANKADLLLVCSYNAWKNPSQSYVIQFLIQTDKPVILLVLRDPQDATLFPGANIILQTFSPTAVSIQAACKKLWENT